ncbi:aminotransferase class I/II-fold pyridoxal phosphate-dependent enzyme [Lysinibacillus sp. KU-BSD001]|uniref:pyridoxal phosphate-dependent aminotransferase n=1 Tax=Lysinibacillus sp. KU-BSD001 TaxID=3141328 RepID=UPI0036E841AA
MQYPAHGANADALYKALRIQMPNKVIDLSENVNPAGVPPSVQHAWPSLINHITMYPNEQAEPFRSKVAAFHDVKPEHIIVGNGAAECLMVLARYFNGGTVGVIEPSFSEYRRTLLQENVTVQSIVVDDICTYKFSMEQVKAAMHAVDAVYLCNPNNPTGALTTKMDIQALLEYGQKVSCTLVVDEAFMDWTDEVESVISLVEKYENLIVLRSMTKMYALAGIRLGYIVSQKAPMLAGFFPHWNVSGVANQVGCLCLEEDQYVAQARQSSAQIREEMTNFLKDYACEVSNSAANFLLFQLPQPYNPDHFFKTLLSAGIVLRHTKNYVGLDGQWFRLAMKEPEKMTSFMRVFTDYVQNN